MNKITYDLHILASSGEIEAWEAVAGFKTKNEYFSKLTSFLDKSPKFLQYTPTVIAYLEDVRVVFLNETEELKEEFISLGMKKIIHIFDDLSEAAQKGDIKVISDKMVQFKAELEMITTNIKEARITETVRPTVLAVDDMPEILTLVSEMLAPDYKVIAVTSAKAALEVLDSHTPDIFLLDVEMPEETGLELAHTIRKMDNFAKTPILFLTSLSKKETVMEAKKIGRADYILKPVDKKGLVSRVEKNLNV
ncbi:MAG: response regulator [Clostridiales bacterium]|jgi:PleD family two-component response regulator|nr:response regulator [Clostridiales bacterium]